MENIRLPGVELFKLFEVVFEENLLSFTLGSHRTLVRNNFLTLVVQLTISFVHSLLRKLLQRGLALILTYTTQHCSILLYL